MRSWLSLITVAMIGLASQAAEAALPAPTHDQVEFYRTYDPAPYGDAGETRSKWERQLRGALKSQTPEAAADHLAGRYGFTDAEMRELVELWLVAQSLDDMQLSQPDAEATERELHARFIALVRATHHAPLALETAASALSANKGCLPDELVQLAEGEDRISVGWRLATLAGCSGWYEGFIRVAPDKAAAPLVVLAQTNDLKAADLAALLAILTREAAMSHVAPADRTGLSVRLHRVKLGVLMGAGLADQTVQAFEALPPEVRANVAGSSMPARIIQVDGLPVPLQEDGKNTLKSFRLELAAAYALAGRKAEARSLLAASEALDAARRQFACIYTKRDIGKGAPCPFDDGGTFQGAIMLDALLNRPAEDPYPFAEVYFGSEMDSMSAGGSGFWGDLKCSLFSEPQYREICDVGRQSTVDFDRGLVDDYQKDNVAAARAVLAAAQIPDWDSQRATFEAALEAAAQAHGGVGRPKFDRAHWHGDGPLPARFAELPLPEAYRGTPPKQNRAWIKGLAPLPEGYEPVRIERDGRRVAAITVSQNYDPTGEVSRGGYWVHLSEDAGKTWRRPLYTGLSELYPYVVLEASRMPLFDGDALDVTVEVKELDTASIIYPPVALRTKRRASDLYLKIPLADLTRDSLGDGMTDIAREHLLLGGPGAAGSTAFRVGTQPVAHCTASPTPEQQVVVKLLEILFKAHTGAIIEPVDSGQDLSSRLIDQLAAAAKGDPNSDDRPIFIEGARENFECLKSDRMIIVYSSDDLVRLRKMTPDFHATTLSRIVFNRFHDRGYVSWSTGWSGGTARVMRVGDAWIITQIGGWIT